MKWALGMVLFAACGSVSEEKMDAKAADAPMQVDAAPDADTRRCDPAKPFAAPVRITELSSPLNDLWPTLTSDELTVYFHSDRGGAGTVGIDDIFVATRPSLSAPFGPPAVLANVNNPSYDQCPSITGDGLTLYTGRKINNGPWEIFVSQRVSTSVDFSAPTAVTSINGTDAFSDEDHFILADNSAMYFISTRTGKEEIHRAARNVGGTFDAPTTPLILTASSEIAAVVTPDELTMYFSSDMTPTVGLVDIWMSKRSTKADGWGTPTHLADLSTDQVDYVSAVSADGCNLYLSHYDSAATSQEIYWARKPL